MSGKRFGRQRLVGELIDKATISRVLGNNELLVRHKPIADRALPGRVIMKLPPEEREQVQQLTAKDFQGRMGNLGETVHVGRGRLGRR